MEREKGEGAYENEEREKDDRNEKRKREMKR